MQRINFEEINVNKTNRKQIKVAEIRLLEISKGGRRTSYNFKQNKNLFPNAIPFFINNKIYLHLFSIDYLHQFARNKILYKFCLKDLHFYLSFKRSHFKDNWKRMWFHLEFIVFYTSFLENYWRYSSIFNINKDTKPPNIVFNLDPKNYTFDFISLKVLKLGWHISLKVIWKWNVFRHV